ncbi:hypothetical protein ACFL6Y_03580 [Elusimicrobiota bacterium]
MNKRGVALLQALIFVGLIMMTSAAILILTLGGFIQSAKGSESKKNKYHAEAVLPLVYEQLRVCDPALDYAGTCPGTIPAECLAANSLADSVSCSNGNWTFAFTLSAIGDWETGARVVNVNANWTTDKYTVLVTPD